MLIFGVFTSYLRKLPTASAEVPYLINQVFMNVFLQPLKSIDFIRFQTFKKVSYSLNFITLSIQSCLYSFHNNFSGSIRICELHG